MALWHYLHGADFWLFSLLLIERRRTKEQNEIMLTMNCSLNQSLLFLSPHKTNYFPLRNDFKNYEFSVFQVHLLEIKIDLQQSFLRKKTKQKTWCFLWSLSCLVLLPECVIFRLYFNHSHRDCVSLHLTCSTVSAYPW